MSKTDVQFWQCQIDRFSMVRAHTILTILNTMICVRVKVVFLGSSVSPRSFELYVALQHYQKPQQDAGFRLEVEHLGRGQGKVLRQKNRVVEELAGEWLAEQ
jgi:hypothetical protein